MRDAKEIAKELQVLLAQLAELELQIEKVTTIALVPGRIDNEGCQFHETGAALDRQRELLEKIKTVSKEYISNISRVF